MAIASDCLITLFILQTVASFCSSAACVSSIVCARDSSIRFTCTCTTQTQRRVVQGEFSLRDLVGLAVHLHGRGRTISRAPPSFLSSLRHTHPTLLYCLSVPRYSRPASLLPVCPASASAPRFRTLLPVAHLPDRHASWRQDISKHSRHTHEVANQIGLPRGTGWPSETVDDWRNSAKHTMQRRRARPTDINGRSSLVCSYYCFCRPYLFLRQPFDTRTCAQLKLLCFDRMRTSVMAWATNC